MKAHLTAVALGSLIGTAHAAPPADWSGVVARIIAARQHYPRSAELRGEEGTTRIRLMVAQDGRISRLELEKSSGSAILDSEAQATIRSIGKLPPPPEGATSLLIPITWRLE